VKLSEPDMGRRNGGSVRRRTRGYKVAAWIEANCVFTQGEWVGKPFRLLPWQKRLLLELFELGPSGRRRYRWALGETLVPSIPAARLKRVSAVRGRQGRAGGGDRRSRYFFSWMEAPPSGSERCEIAARHRPVNRCRARD
jgi:hypothetical protein